MNTTLTEIATVIKNRVSSMSKRIGLVYLRARGLRVKAYRRIDWDYPGYQLTWYFGLAQSQFQCYIASFSLMKVIERPVEGQMYQPRIHYKGFAFTSSIQWGGSGLLTVCFKTPRRYYEYPLIPRIGVRLYV